jgi:hypothetical protein
MPKSPSVIVSASFQRSGSSWLQRVVATALDGVIWGEFPYPLIESLRDSFDSISAKEHVSRHQRHDYFEQGRVSGWYANMMPTPDHYLDAQRVFLVTLLSHADKAWGWKAVNHSVEDLQHVALLFPSALQILLVRDLRAVYASLLARGWDQWWQGGVSEIARTWSERSLGYAHRAAEKNTIFVRYEDLSITLPSIIRAIGGDLERAQVEVTRVVSKTAWTGLDPETLSELESVAGSTLVDLGYSC